MKITFNSSVENFSEATQPMQLKTSQCLNSVTSYRVLSYQCRKGRGVFLNTMKAVSPSSTTFDSVNVHPHMAYLGVVNAILLQQLYTRPFV